MLLTREASLETAAILIERESLSTSSSSTSSSSTINTWDNAPNLRRTFQREARLASRRRWNQSEAARISIHSRNYDNSRLWKTQRERTDSVRTRWRVTARKKSTCTWNFSSERHQNENIWLNLENSQSDFVNDGIPAISRSCFDQLPDIYQLRLSSSFLPLQSVHPILRPPDNELSIWNNNKYWILRMRLRNSD